MSKDTSPEAPRGFAVLLQQVDEGALHAEVSETIQQVAADLSKHSENHGVDAKGSITLTLSLVACRNGTVTVEGDVKTKLPKVKRAGSVFWLTKGNNLTPENPRQQKLPLRQVPQADEKPREVEPAAAAPARTV